MTKSLAFRQMRVFLLVWFEQLVSVIGSDLTSFALGVWVYQRTGSVTQFSLILLSAMLPSMLISPVAGALVDRWNRRWYMILSDSGAGITTVAIADRRIVASWLTNTRSWPHALFPTTIRAARDVSGLCW
jgi:MFS family permease